MRKEEEKKIRNSSYFIELLDLVSSSFIPLFNLIVKYHAESSNMSKHFYDYIRNSNRQLYYKKNFFVAFPVVLLSFLLMACFCPPLYFEERLMTITFMIFSYRIDLQLNVSFEFSVAKVFIKKILKCYSEVMCSG